MKNPVLAIVVFVGVFLCGGVVGGAVSIHYYERFVRTRGVDRFFEKELRELSHKLELTPGQSKDFRVVFSRAMADQRAARKQSEVIIERMVADFEAMLTPEQLVKFKDYRAKQRAAREQQMRERRSGSSGPDGSRPSPFFMERRERERSPNPSAPPRPESTEPPAPTSGEERKPSP